VRPPVWNNPPLHPSGGWRGLLIPLSAGAEGVNRRGGSFRFETTHLCTPEAVKKSRMPSNCPLTRPLATLSPEGARELSLVLPSPRPAGEGPRVRGKEPTIRQIQFFHTFPSGEGTNFYGSSRIFTSPVWRSVESPRPPEPWRPGSSS
jgi:hypothetical protein